jgi:fimbrial isopeptide formation D2 family protein
VTDRSGNTDSVKVSVTVTDNVSRETNITKRIDQDRNVVHIGDTVVFVLTATNAYGGDRNLIIVDSLPDGLSLVEESVPGNTSVRLDKKVIAINHGFLAEGETVSYTIAARVEQEGTWTNYAYLYRAEKRISDANATLTAERPNLVLTAEIREGDYTTKILSSGTLSPSTYNVSGDYRLVTTLENKGGATVNRIDVKTTYDPAKQQYVVSSGAEVTDYGNEITWTVHNLEGKDNLEITFKPLVAAICTLRSEIATYLPHEIDRDDNVASVAVNQAIVSVPNVLTSGNPKLYIDDLVKIQSTIKEATMRIVNTWGNQVHYIRYPGDGIPDSSTREEKSWFDVNATNIARGTYWYELVIQYKTGETYVIKDYIEVLR